MGIDANLVPLLREFSDRSSFAGTICTLGIQDLPEGAEQWAFFASLGFSSVETLDLPGTEGVDHAFDLNDPNLPPHLFGRFDAVLNGGTLEHVFHLPNALRSVTRMLRPGGYAIHVLPCNGWVDHGYYQISPALMFDYYSAAGFRILESALCSFELRHRHRWQITSVAPGDFGMGLAGSIDRGIHLYVFAAQRGATVVEGPTPLQSLYGEAEKPNQPRWFPPFLVEHGHIDESAPAVSIDLLGFDRETGHCWIAALPAFADVADTSVSPARSPLMLLEDQERLGPPHAGHAMIREIGRGAFSHWGQALYFSTSDNSDPQTNGRNYRAVIGPSLGLDLP
ncbi:MAG TPA: methyltransferase domain-containing protein [Stellaceae bacterium]